MPLEVDDGSSVFLVTSGPSTPLAVNGTIISHDDNVLVIRVDEPSAPDADPRDELADRREVQRYPTWLDATLFAPRFPEGQDAVITDLSNVGAGVEVDRWDDDAFFRLEFVVQDEVLQIECETVQVENTWRGFLVHARFVLMAQEQQETLDALVAALKSVFGEAQEHLATYRLAPAFR